MARFSRGGRSVDPVSASETYDPQLAKLFKGWSHELKFDGYRSGARREGAGARLVSRNRNDWTQQFPEVAQALERLKAERALLDGDVCVLDERGRPDFGRLQNLGLHRWLRGGLGGANASFLFSSTRPVRLPECIAERALGSVGLPSCSQRVRVLLQTEPKPVAHKGTEAPSLDGAYSHA